MRRSWITLAAITCVFGLLGGVAYVEGASLAITLDGLRNIAEIEHRQLRVCTDRFGLAVVIVEVIGLTVLSWLTWRCWTRCIVAFALFFFIQFTLVATAFLLTQGVLISLVNGAGSVIKKCLCY